MGETLRILTYAQLTTNVVAELPSFAFWVFLAASSLRGFNLGSIKPLPTRSIVVNVTAKRVAALLAEGTTAALAEAAGKLASTWNSAGRGLAATALGEGTALASTPAALGESELNLSWAAALAASAKTRKARIL